MNRLKEAATILAIGPSEFGQGTAGGMRFAVATIRAAIEEADK